MSNVESASRASLLGRRPIRRYIARAIALLAALLFAVGSLAVVSPFGSQTGLYLVDRDLGLAILLLVLLLIRWDKALGAVLLATAGMHVVDGIGDFALQNLPAGIGSIVVAIVSIVAAWWLLREPDSDRPTRLGTST